MGGTLPGQSIAESKYLVAWFKKGVETSKMNTFAIQSCGPNVGSDDVFHALELLRPCDGTGVCMALA